MRANQVAKQLRLAISTHNIMVQELKPSPPPPHIGIADNVGIVG